MQLWQFYIPAKFAIMEYFYTWAILGRIRKEAVTGDEVGIIGD
jgi:hypothetical protein